MNRLKYILIFVAILVALLLVTSTILASSEKTPNLLQHFSSSSGEASFTANVSAYCLCKKCCGKDVNHPAFGITASGYKVKLGDGNKLVAAARNVPFGTMLLIPGYNNNKPVPVFDRGGAIKDNKIDLLFNDSNDLSINHKEALKWGRQVLTVKTISNKQSYDVIARRWNGRILVTEDSNAIRRHESR